MYRLPFLALFLVACGDNSSTPPPGDDAPDAADDPPDAGGDGTPIEVDVWVSGAPADVVIDGVVGDERIIEYPDYDDVPASIDVTLVDGALELDRDTIELRQAVEECTFGQPEPETPTYFEASFCGWANGELRFSSLEIGFPSSPCVRDGFCFPACEPTLPDFCPDQKCGSSFASDALEWSRLDCVPAGAQPIGEACEYTAGDDGRFVDDCARGAACVDGTCREVCAGVEDCEDGETCATPTGHAEELKVCRPAA